MSKMGRWFLAMQEDAQEMEYWEFIARHGKDNIDVWREIHDSEYENTNVDEYMAEGMDC